MGLALISVLCLSRAGLLQGLASGWRQPQNEPHPFGLVLPNQRPLPSLAVLAEMSRPTSADTTQPARVYTYAEVVPRPAGGDSASSRLVRQTMRYPAAARLYHTKGLVYVSFLVGTRGEVLNPHVVKRLGYGCDEEALRVITGLPFEPGRQGGQPVVVQLLWAFYFCSPEEVLVSRQ